MDPFLDSINNLLMEEGMDEDAACTQQDGGPAFQAIYRSFYDIIGENPRPKSSVASSSYENLHALYFPHEIPEQHHIMHFNGCDILTHHMLNSGASTETLANLQRERERVDTGLMVTALLQQIVSPNSANLPALSTTGVEDYRQSIEVKDAELMDTQLSGWARDKGLNNFRSCISVRGDKEEGHTHFQLPSAYKESSLNLTGMELSFEDLKIHDYYEALYAGKPGILAGAPKLRNKEKVLAVAGKGGKSGKKRTASAQEYVDLKELIVNCAQAVVVGNSKLANEVLQNIWHVHGASAGGNGLQRAVHYFGEALVARMRGIGDLQFRAISAKMPSEVTILKSYKTWFEVMPYVTVIHYFANQSILKVAHQASRLHIVDYGLQSGMQWPFLINALADQKGGPPLLVITGIDFAQPGNNPAESLEKSGRRLAAYARTYNVPFQYHAIASSKWEDLDLSSFHFHEDEVLVVNCIKSLRHLADESVDMISPRQKLLSCIRNLNPHLLITADVNAAANSSFVPRFREALNFYANVFEMVDTLTNDSPERIVKERILYRDILNIVACEGVERGQRPETYKKWQARIERAGFEQLLIPPAILTRSRSHVKQHYHKDFLVHDDNKWMLLGWRGRISMAISAWKPCKLGRKGDAQ